MLRREGFNDYINNIIMSIDDINGDGKYTVNDFLDMDNNDILKENGGKKFDVTLMNPPYDKSLHLKFLEKTIKISDNVVSIQPIRWLQDPISKNKKVSAYNKYKESIFNHIKDIEVINSKISTKLFGGENITTINFDLGIYVCDKTGGWNNIFENKILEKIINKTNGIPITKFKDINKKCFCLLTLIDGGHRERGGGKSSYDIIRNEKWYGKYYVNGISTNGNSVEENKKRNKMATNGNIQTWPIVQFNTEEECKNFYNFTKTKFFKYIYKEEMVDVNVHPQYLPFMEDYTKEWSNEMIYKYFELTEEEIKIIENANI